jgi:hypothetical protein
MVGGTSPRGANATAGAVNTGSGGGGGGFDGGGGNYLGGAGGSGFVVVRYALPAVTTPNLLGADDTGTTTDDITSTRTLRFFGNAPLTSSIQLSVATATSATDTDSSTGTWTNTGSACTANSTGGEWECTTAQLAPGLYKVRSTTTTNMDGLTDTQTSSTALVVNIDTTAPTVTSVAFTSDAGTDNTYKTGDIVSVSVAFSETVTVTGIPRIPILGLSSKFANYASGSGTNTLVFTHTVVALDTDTDGLAVTASTLALNSGTIKDVPGNNAILTHDAVAAQSAHKVDTTAPTVTSVAFTSDAGTDNTYKADDIISISATFSETVTVTGFPQIPIAGLTSKFANYSSGSGTNTLVFTYTVVSGDTDTNGLEVLVNRLTLNAGTITDIPGNNATITHTAVATQSAHKVDTTAPTITSVSYTSNAGTDNTYKTGDIISISVTFSEAVVITESPQIPILGLTNKFANYASGSGSSTIVFTYTVILGDTDTDGLAITANTLDLNSGTIRDIAGNNATLTHAAVATQSAHKVDTTAPTITSVSYTSNAGTDNTYKTGDIVSVSVTFSETVTVTSTPRISAVVGLSSKDANYSSGSGTNTLVFTYTVAALDTDTDGLEINADTLALNAGTIRDVSGNNAIITHAAVAAQSAHKVDTTAPTITGIAFSSDAGTDNTYKTGDIVNISVTFSEPVTASGTPLIPIVGLTNKSAFRESSSSGTNTLVFKYTIVSGDTDTDGLAISANTLIQNAGSTITDVPGNNATLTHAAVAAQSAHKVDTTAPTVTGVAFTSDAGTDNTYKADDIVSVSVTFSETVTVTSTPRISVLVGMSNKDADYSSGSGTNTLVFRYTIATGFTDSDGLAVSANMLSLNTGTITDVPGNNATLTHAAVANQSAHKVDTTAPTVSVVNSTTLNGFYKSGDVIAITVRFSEIVTVDTAGGTPALTLETGTVDSSAPYASGSGSETLVFNYTVQPGDTSSDLTYPTTNSISLNGGSITDVPGTNATLTLASPLAANSLAANKAFVIDGVTPSAPRITSAVETGTTITLNFSAPVSKATSVTGYQVQTSTNGSTWSTSSSTVAADATSYRITGLAPGTAYYVRIAAKYGASFGPYGYRFEKIYEVVNPTRTAAAAIQYASGFGLGVGDARATYSDTAFTRVRYRMATTYRGGNSYVDANFNRTF